MAKIKFRRDTAAAWTESNPTLAQGEPGFEYDTGLLKIGDGESDWNSLAYSSGGGASLTDEGNVTVTAGSTEHWLATQRRNDNDSSGRGLRYDSTGNLYTIVYSWTGGEMDPLAVITKYTPAGAVSWQKTIPDAIPVSLAIDSSDRAYVALNKNSNLNLFKFDTDGTVLWKKLYTIDAGNNNLDDAFIEEKSSTSIIVACNRDPDGTRSSVIFDIDTTTGAVNTQKEIVQTGSDVYVEGIDIDPSQNVFVSGRYFDPGDEFYKMYITKLDTDLVEVWTKSLESPNGYDMNGGDCASDALGNIYAVGYYDVNVINHDGNNSESRAAS